MTALREPTIVDQFFQRSERGLFQLETWRRDIIPQWLGFDPQSSNSNGTATATQIGKTFLFLQTHSDFAGLSKGVGSPNLINALTFLDVTSGNDLSNVMVMLKDLGDAQQFMNNAIHIRALAGDNLTPAKPGCPWMIESQHAIQATLSGSTHSIYMNLVGSQFMPWSPELNHGVEKSHKPAFMVKMEKAITQSRFIKPYWLTTNLGSMVLSANGTGMDDAIISDGSQFEATHLLSIATGDYEVNIYDPDTRRSLSNGPIRIEADITANYPLRLPVPFLIPSGSRVHFDFTDLSGSTNTINIVLRGRRLIAPLIDMKEAS